jgi:hypothetical protein
VETGEDDKEALEDGVQLAGEAADSGYFDGLEERLEMLNMMARGELDIEDSSESEEEAPLDETVEPEEGVPDIGEGASAPQTTETTKRLALVNLDWDHTRAEDIFAVLSSFVPAGGSLVSVKVYPSDFGEKMLLEEERLGPKGIWADGEAEDAGRKARKARLQAIDDAAHRKQLKRQARRNARDIEEDDNDEEESASEEDDSRGSEDEGEAFNPERLRLYELSRLKYFFAEAEFDSCQTASAVYDECDGREFGVTGTTLDLRFIPDDTTFEHKTVRDEARSFDLERYEEPEFTTSALGSTKVELSWDAADSRREKKLKRWISEMRQAEEQSKKKKRKPKPGMPAAKVAGTAPAGLTPDQVLEQQESELREFLAPPSDEDDGSDESESDDLDVDGELDESKRKQKLQAARVKARALLQAALESDDEGGAEPAGWGEEEDMEAEGDREMTFTMGLDEKLERKQSEKEQSEKESAWDAYQRRRREKKREKRQQQKKQREDIHEATAAGEVEDGFFANDDDEVIGFQAGEEERAASRGLRLANDEEVERKKKQRAAERAERAVKAAEAEQRKRREEANLALLMMANPGTADAAAESSARGFDSRALARAQKDATGKGGTLSRKRRREEAAQMLEADSFQIDTVDPRFARVSHDPDMAIDPTNPSFKDTPAMRSLLQSRARASEAEPSSKRVLQADPHVQGGAALASLIANVKRKSAAAKSRSVH